MSCNGCRVLRKGCNENCILRQSLQGIDTPQAQGNATVFVAKFFGRAGLMSFLSGVPEPQRPALFQSLLFEACGRTINPVNGAVGLLWTGNWSLCQAAVDTVLRGGVVRPMAEFSAESTDIDFGSRDLRSANLTTTTKQQTTADLDLCLAGGRGSFRSEKRRAVTPSEESGTTTLESGRGYHRHQGREEVKLLQLFL